MAQYKPAEDMAEQEAKEYCEELMKANEWQKSFVEMCLKEGGSYKEIAFFAQNN